MCVLLNLILVFLRCCLVCSLQVLVQTNTHKHTFTNTMFGEGKRFQPFVTVWNINDQWNSPDPVSPSLCVSGYFRWFGQLFFPEWILFGWPSFLHVLRLTIYIWTRTFKDIREQLVSVCARKCWLKYNPNLGYLITQHWVNIGQDTCWVILTQPVVFWVVGITQTLVNLTISWVFFTLLLSGPSSWVCFKCNPSIIFR